MIAQNEGRDTGLFSSLNQTVTTIPVSSEGLYRLRGEHERETVAVSPVTTVLLCFQLFKTKP